MNHLPDALYDEQMPRRAKRLFVDTFSQHHKLNAGDEDAAMQKARQAVEARYVRVNDLQWIPRRAAYEIIRDEMSSGSEDESARVSAPSKTATFNSNNRDFSKQRRRRTSETSTNSSISGHSTDDENELVSTAKTRTARTKKRRVGGTATQNLNTRQQYSTDEDEY